MGTKRTTEVGRALAHRMQEQGWRSGTIPEDAAADFMYRVGLGPTVVRQQHHIGPYRVDFAVPEIKVVIEIDGWHHAHPESAMADQKRDNFLRGEDWLVFRLATHEERSERLDVLFECVRLDELARVCEVIILLLGTSDRYPLLRLLDRNRGMRDGDVVL